MKSKNFILYINIRSLNAKFEKLEVFIDNLNIKPSIIVLSEKWFVQHSNFYNLAGYNSFYNNSFINKADGVCMYIKNNISAETDTIVIDRLNLLCSNINMPDGSSLCLTAVYRTHSIPKSEFTHSFKKYLMNSRNTKNHIIVGDFNIDILDTNMKENNAYDNTYNQDFLNTMVEYKYKPLFTGVTRPSDHTTSGTCIDNFYVKSLYLETISFKLLTPFNDHLPLLLSFNKIEPQLIQNVYKNHISFKKMNQLAKQVNWNELFDIRDPNIAIITLVKNIQTCVDKSTFRKVSTINSTKCRKNEWITKAITISCKTKEML